MVWMARCLRLAFLALLVVPAAAADADVDAGTLPPVGVRSSPAWLTVTTGPAAASQHEAAPQLFAITATSRAGALTPFDVLGGLRRLDTGTALIWAMTISRGGHPTSFGRAPWPPRLVDFRLDRGWEGQPLPRIQQRLLAIAVGAWNLDIRVYFGTQHPGRALLGAVQAELDRLTLPAP
jgi:hypothetical protein